MKRTWYTIIIVCRNNPDGLLVTALYDICRGCPVYACITDIRNNFDLNPYAENIKSCAAYHFRHPRYSLWTGSPHNIRIRSSHPHRPGRLPYGQAVPSPTVIPY